MENSRKDVFMKKAHDIRATITIKGLGSLVISHSNLNDIIDTLEHRYADDRAFSVSLLSRIVREPSNISEKLNTCEDIVIEELGRKWLDFEKYFLKEFEAIEKNSKTKDLNFFIKFKMAIEAPEKRELERLKPVLEQVTKESQRAIKSFTDTFKVPLGIELPSTIIDTKWFADAGKALTEKIKAINSFPVDDAIKKMHDLNIAGGFAEAMKASNGLINLQEKIVEDKYVDFPEALTLPPNPHSETVTAINKVEKTIFESIELTRTIQESYVAALEKQNKSSKENTRLQKQVRTLTISLVVLTIILAVMGVISIYPLILKP